MLRWNCGRPTSNISIISTFEVVGKFVQLVPVLLQRVGDLVRVFWCSEFQNWIIVHRPVLSLLVLTPNLVALDAEDLHADTTRCGHIVCNQLGGERGVSHNHVVCARLLEHALRQMLGEIVLDYELANHALRMSALDSFLMATYSLCLEVSASQAVVMFIKIHHLESIELSSDLFDLLLLARLRLLDAGSVPGKNQLVCGIGLVSLPFDVFRHCDVLFYTSDLVKLLKSAWRASSVISMLIMLQPLVELWTTINDCVFGICSFPSSDNDS